MSPPSLEKGNPYAAPSASLQPDDDGSAARFNPDGKSVGSDRVVGWYGSGFDMFKSNVGIWIVMSLVFMVIVVVLSFIPLVNIAVNIIFPVFVGGFMLGCAAIDRGEDLRIDHLFEGFQKHFGSLAIVGLLYMAILFGMMIVVGILAAMVIGIGGLGAMMSGGGNGSAALFAGGVGIGIILLVLVVLALSIPLAMAVWYAPALVVFHNMAPIDAMKSSFSGCMKNILPFLIYGILYLVFAIVATIPFGLGWFVLGPVIVASVYTSYKEIYLS